MHCKGANICRCLLRAWQYTGDIACLTLFSPHKHQIITAILLKVLLYSFNDKETQTQGVDITSSRLHTFSSEPAIEIQT